MAPGHKEYPARGDGDDCRVVRGILDRVGDKWSLYIVLTLHEGPIRFNELRRRIEGISQRMLTITLRNLERDGLITRTMYPTVPARVEYDMTEVGKTLLSPVLALVQWADTHQDYIQDAQTRYDADEAPA